MLSHFHFDEISSTQDKAFELLECETSAPFIVTADLQTAGRGRMQREWAMERGRSVAFSLVAEHEASKLVGLSLMVGLVCREVIGLPELRLKWPNDLMLDNEKVGGILIESRSQGAKAIVVIGVGLNSYDFQLQRFRGLQKRVDAVHMGERILEDLGAFRVNGFMAYQKAYESVMWKRGERVRLRVDSEERFVVLRGVTENGLLMIDADGELSLSDQGEIVHG